MRYIVLACAILVGCAPNKGGSNDTAEQAQGIQEEILPSQGGMPHSMMMASAAALPECTAEAEGWLVYLKAEKEFQVCSAGAWEGVDITASQPDEPPVPNETLGIFDSADKFLGYAVSEGQRIGLMPEGTGYVIWLRSLQGGFDLAGDYQPCLYFAADCTGTCLLRDLKKPAYIDATHVMLPKAAKISGTTSFRYVDDGGSCAAFGETLIPQARGDEYSISLPLSMKKLEP